MARRWFIFVPEINPGTFVFFFYRGDTGRSWSIRDYVDGNGTPQYADEFPWTADEVLALARRPGCHAVQAESMRTGNESWYVGRLSDLNSRLLGRRPEVSVPPDSHSSPSSTTGLAEPAFPILDLDLLRSHPKAGKGQDMQRILTAPRSEDWVTRNVFRALARRPTEEWWGELLGLVGKEGVDSTSLATLVSPPRVELWRRVASPPEYEAASRRRMANSEQEQWRRRAENPTPVEGTTEVDLVFDGRDYVVFVEAKLDSDVSESTTYDPERNQIVRNIDCVIEEAGGRTPMFWMLVADRGSRRLYTQLVESYRGRIDELVRLLPHRDPRVLEAIASSTAVIRWVDLVPLLPPDLPEDLKLELARRMGAEVPGGT